MVCGGLSGEEHHGNCAKTLTKKAAADAASAATVSPDTPNVLQTMMQLEQAKTRTETANKLTLETEKEKDAAEKAVEELKRQMQPKRSRTHDSTVMLVMLMKCSQRLIIGT